MQKQKKHKKLYISSQMANVLEKIIKASQMKIWVCWNHNHEPYLFDAIKTKKISVYKGMLHISENMASYAMCGITEEEKDKFLRFLKICNITPPDFSREIGFRCIDIKNGE